MRTLFRFFLLSGIAVFTLSSCTEDEIEMMQEEIAEEVIQEEEEEIDAVQEDELEEADDNSIAYHEPLVRATRDKFMDGVQDEATGNITSLTKLEGMDYEVVANVELRGVNYQLEAVFNLLSEEIFISINGEEPFYQPNLSISNCSNCDGDAQIKIIVKDDINGYFSRSFYLDFQSDF